MRYVKLPEIAEMGSGGTPSRKKKEFYKNGTIPWLKSGELNNGMVTSAEEYITKEAVQKSSTKIAPKGSLLVAMYGATAGKVGLLDFDSSMNQAVCFIKPDSKKADVRYLYYYLMSKNQELLDKREGVGQPNISQTILKSLKIPLPSLSMQKAIVAKLDRAQRLIDLDKEMLAKYDDLIKSVFLEMFGDPVTNSKGWELVKLGEVCNTGSGGTPSRKNKEYYNGDIPWIKSGELKGGKIFNAEERISDYALENTSAKLVPINSILIAMYGATVGRVAELKISASINQAICYIDPNRNKLINPFLFNFLKLITDELLNKRVGGGQPNINQGIVKDIDLFIPPIELQLKFASLIDKIEMDKVKSNASAKKSEELFSSLVQGAFG